MGGSDGEWPRLDQGMGQSGLPPVFVPGFKLELNPILNCFVAAEAVEGPKARQPPLHGVLCCYIIT